MRIPFLYNTVNDWFSLCQETSFMLKYVLPHLLVGSQKGPQKLKRLWTSSFWLVTCVYFKVHTSHSHFQICWGMNILLWSVNTDQDSILITWTNSKIVVTNQFHLCNGSSSWKFQLQVITSEESCHISAIESQPMIKHCSTKCPLCLVYKFLSKYLFSAKWEVPSSEFTVEMSIHGAYSREQGTLSRSCFHKFFFVHF